MFARFSLAASIVLSTLCLAPGARAGATLADTWIEPGSGMEFVLIKHVKDALKQVLVKDKKNEHK